MAMRLSGLMSGMDTESIIKQLVEAKSVKVTTAKKAQTKLSWKQDAWKELNTKLKNLQSKFLSNMRFSSSYTKKVTKVSNPNAVSVITGENAVNGVQSLKIGQLAKTGYLTGGVVSTNGGDATAMTKISDLDVAGGFSAPGTINVTTGDKSVDINITSDTTISDVLSQLKDAGLNASFDAKWGRFSISSKESGAKNDFSITAVDAGGAKALEAMKLQTALVDENGNESAAYKEYKEYSDYYQYYLDNSNTIPTAMQDKIDRDVESRRASYEKQYTSLAASLKSAQETIDKFSGAGLDTVENYEKALKEKNEKIVELNNKLNEAASPLTEAEKQKIKADVSTLMDEVKDLALKKTDRESLDAAEKSKTELTAQMANVEKYVTLTDNGDGTYSAAVKQDLTDEVEKRYMDKAEQAHQVIADYNNNSYKASEGATKVNGQDAEISLNGAVYTNDTNVFEINGLTFTALAETKGDEITVTTEQDVDGIYDMVKNFLKEYNSIINEMDKLYNADSARGYEPLSDEEREAMSDSDIEKYEKKIKDSLLRRDENLSTVSSGLKSIMSSGIEVNGQTMYLFNFGIETLSYFTAADNEKNAYHIDGDPDDTSTSGNADKLRSMIANDPDTVISFFTKLSQNLYDKMTDMSRSVDGYRTFGSFYDDKKMKSDYDDYTTKIKDLEAKLNDYEDKWYKKFAAMETAMAKMQQNSSAVTALLGGGS